MTKIIQKFGFESAADVNDFVKIPSDQVEIEIKRDNGDTLPKKSEKEVELSLKNTYEQGTPKEQTSVQDASGDSLEVGDIVLLFSDELSEDISIEDYFKDILSEDNSEKKDGDCPIEIPKMLNSFMPNDIQPMMIVMMDSDNVTASSVTLNNKKHAFVEEGVLHIVPIKTAYRFSKINEAASYTEAMSKLYSDIIMYNAIKDTELLTCMLT